MAVRLLLLFLFVSCSLCTFEFLPAEESQSPPELDGLLYSYSTFYIPVSTSSLYAAQSTTAISPNKKKMLLIAEGFLLGVAAVTHVDHLVNCVTGTQSEIQQFHEAMKNIATHDPAKVFQGIVGLGKAFKAFPDAMNNCRTIGQDLVTITKIVQHFITPHNFLFEAGKNLFVNGIDIWKEISQALRDYQKQDWKSFGQNVGKAGAQIVFGGK